MAGIPLALNFDLGAPLPLDSRLLVANTNQLNSINPKYSGMIVYAANTQKLYYLEDLNTNTWSQIGTGSFGGGVSLNNVVYTSGDQTISGSKTFIATGFHYSGGFYRYDKQTRTVFEENVFINKINNQTSFGIYNHYFLNKLLPISGQLTNLPVGIRTGNIVNLFFNNSGINDSNENNFIVEPTVMVKYTGNIFTNDIIPIVGHPFYTKRALKKINYNGITENVVYTTGNQTVNGTKTIRNLKIGPSQSILDQTIDINYFGNNWRLVSNNTNNSEIIDNALIRGSGLPGGAADYWAWRFNADPNFNYGHGVLQLNNPDAYSDENGQPLGAFNFFDISIFGSGWNQYFYLDSRSGVMRLSKRPTVNGTGVLLSGDIPRLPNTVVYTTGNQSIIGEKEFGAPTYFTDLLEASTDKLIFNNIYTGRMPEDFDMNWTTLGTSVGMSSDGTILGIGVNNYLTGSGNSIPSFRPLTGLLAKCYIYTRNENTSDWVFKEEISRQVPAATNANFPRWGVQSVNFSSDGSILFFGFDEKIEIYTGSKNTTWNNLIQTLSGESIISGGGTFGGTVGVGNGISFSRNCSCIAVAEAGNDSLARNAGKIYLYTGSVNTKWALKQTLVPPVISQLYQSTIDQYYGKPKFNDDGSVLFLGRGLGQNNTNSIDIYTGSSSNGWTLKQNLIISGDPLFGVVGTDSWIGANIDCDQNGTVFIFSKNNNFGFNQQYASVDIWSGNKNNGWQFKNSLLNTRNGSHTQDTKVFFSRDREYIIHTEPSQGGDAGGINLWKRTSEFNYLLSQNIYSASALAPFVPNIGIPNVGISIGGGQFGFSFASDDNFNNIIVGAPQANILWGRPGCAGNACAADLGYATSFNLRKQSLKLNSQDTNAPLLEINGEMIIDSPFRPKYNNSGILVQGEAVTPNSNAQLNSLKFKNESNLSLEGPRLISKNQGSGVSSSIGIYSDYYGEIVDFTETGVQFFNLRPTVNGSGVLLQGEAILGDALDAFNGNRAITLDVAGFKNVNAGGNTISGFLNNLFFPFAPATISLNPYSLQELGTIYSTVLFTGAITQNSETQISFLQYMNGDTVLNTVPSPSFGNFGATFTLNLTGSSILRARVNTNNNGSARVITGSQTLSFVAPSWYGAGVNGLVTGVRNMTKYLNIKANRTFTFNTVNNHFYYAYPNDWGSLNSIIDQNGFNITTSFSNTTGNLLLANNTTNYVYRIYQSINSSSNTNFNITFNF